MKYRAFISYSHRDKSWGDWLHKSLEHYKVPKPLVGRPTTRGELVPARIFPVFRDREELPTAVDLGEIINRALEESRYLIVICSPASARSLWVNQEIIQYKRLGGENRVLAIIVEGEPNASSGKPGFTADEECFPEALRYKLGADGQLSQDPTEPIAADARPHADGKANAVLKLIAGVLGVNYDDLKRRDEIQRRRRQRLILATVSTLTVVISVLALSAWAQKQRADDKAAEAERERNIAIVERKEAILQRNYATEERKEAILQRNHATEEAARAELGLARVSLESNEPRRAALAALAAVEQSESIGRPLEAAWWVLRRALEAYHVGGEWEAHKGKITSLYFSEQGARLLTACPDTGEVAVWSAASGAKGSRWNCADVVLARWVNQDEEILTVHSVYSHLMVPQVDLCWRDPRTGKVLRTKSFPNASTSVKTPLCTPAPEWVSIAEFRGQSTIHRLVRLHDGFSDFTLPVGRVTFTPVDGLAFLTDELSGIRPIRLQDGSLQGALEGLGPAKDLALESLVPSRDGLNIAAVFEKHGRPVAAGVWRLHDGKRLVDYSLSEDRFPWLLAVADDRLAGSSKGITDAVAVHLGRTAVSEALSPGTGQLLAWSEKNADAGPIAVNASATGLSFAGASVGLTYPGLGTRNGLIETTSDVTAGGLDPSAEFLALANSAGQVKLRKTAPPLASEPNLAEPVKAVGTAEGKGLVLLRNASGELKTWDVGARRVMATMKDGVADDPNFTQTFADESQPYLWNPEAQWLVVKRQDATFHDTSTGAFLGSVPLPPEGATIMLSPRGRRALIHTVQGTGKLIVADSGKLETIVLPPHETYSNGAFFPDGERFMLQSQPEFLEIFSATTGQSEGRIPFVDAQGRPENCTAINFHPDGKSALVSSLSFRRKVEFPAGTTSMTLAPVARLWSSAAFIGGGDLLAWCSERRLSWGRLPALAPLGDLFGDYEADRAVVLPGSSKLVVRGGSGSTSLAVCGLEDGRVYLQLEEVVGADAVAGLAALPNAKNGLRIIRLIDGEILAEIPDLQVTSACFAADGSRVGLIVRDSGQFLSLPLNLDKDRLRKSARLLAKEAVDK